jgi:hypothetical protein
VVIGVDGVNSYLSGALEDPGSRRILEGAIRVVFGQELKVRYEFGKKRGPREISPPPMPPEPGPAPSPMPPSNTLVEKALEVFEGRVVKRK